MPATTPEAIQRKKESRMHRDDIKREDKIEAFGGQPLDISDTRLSKAERALRVEYLFDLLYPKRHENKAKRGKGRPRKYDTAGERVSAMRQQAREAYKRKVQADVREYISNPKQAAHVHTPWYNIFMAAKYRAKKNKFPFDLDVQHVANMYKDTTHCPLLGIELVRDTEYAPSLDKIIPAKGYTKDNVWIISRKANTIKNDATFKEFETIYLSWKEQQA